MAREDAFKSGGSNPAKYFLEWKSNEKKFSFYDKEKGENVLIDLPFKFLALDQVSRVGGWDDKSKSGIYSNEVRNLSEQKLTVKSFKGGPIAEGFFKDIKEQVNKMGGHYVRSLYVMSSKGEILNIQFKGACVQAWGDFIKNNDKRLSKQWVVIKSTNEGKKGSVTYWTPIFEFSDSLTSDEAKKADEKYNEVETHIKGEKSATDDTPIDELVSDSDLPF